MGRAPREAWIKRAVDSDRLRHWKWRLAKEGAAPASWRQTLACSDTLRLIAANIYRLLVRGKRTVTFEPDP